MLCYAPSATSDPPVTAPPPPMTPPPPSPPSLPPPPPPPPPPLPPAPPAADSVLPSTSQKQADLRDDALGSVRPGFSAKGKEKADKDDRHNEDGDRTAAGALGVRDSPKCTAEDAGLNEGGKGVPGLRKNQCKGQPVNPGRSLPCLTILKRPYRRRSLVFSVTARPCGRSFIRAIPQI